MKNYLTGEGLWDIIDSDVEARHEENWRSRNAKALYAIQLSCGPDCFEMISEINDAKDAWSRLRQLLSPESKANWADAIDLGNKHTQLDYSDSFSLVAQ